MSKTFYSIREVCTMLNEEPHVLRFWENKIDKLKVLRINTKRHYREKDIDILKRIKSLLRDDLYTIEGAKKALQKNEVRELQQTDQVQ
tara:strand:+ start:187 stop:450 length:264 start_codon:yes stop_codon:yes gene_type:complete